ncbi:MAG: hypothetical protein IPP88_02670 [Betaproteobacteria bacterium]|nr:hypothetical protein [Betaproteobacteria bacterium]
MSSDHFENLIRTLLEADGYWVVQSFKVNVSKQEKRQIGKHTIPRPEIDLLALDFSKNEIIAFEAKSFLDSSGTRASALLATQEIPEGKYKLFTCENYRNIVLGRLKQDLQARAMANSRTTVRLGLVIGNVYARDVIPIRQHAKRQGWVYWSPRLLKRKLRAQAARHENDSVIIATKVLLR